MGIVWDNPQEIDRVFAEAQAEYDRKAINWLCVLGERVVKYARTNGNYTDQTANLRNSIGYIVIQSNKVVYDSFVGSTTPRYDPNGQANAEMAHQRGLEYAKQVGTTLGGYKTYLVWVAGMEYARYVEAKGYDVIQGSGDWVEANAQQLMAEFERYLKAKGK